MGREEERGEAEEGESILIASEPRLRQEGPVVQIMARLSGTKTGNSENCLVPWLHRQAAGSGRASSIALNNAV